ncbi:MAG TPA: hypothetical protein VMW10_01510 [Alphaproteobacteria bacterium]|nr:hypothetical protein [Alphaproteobacteria bacterium]
MHKKFLQTAGLFAFKLKAFPRTKTDYGKFGTVMHGKAKDRTKGRTGRFTENWHPYMCEPR